MATIDGQVHAFKVSASMNSDKNTSDSLVNNEMWSFFPAVLQHLATTSTPAAPTSSTARRHRRHPRL